MAVVVIDRPPLWRRVLPIFQGFDWPLVAIVILLGGLGLGVMYSVAHELPGRFELHARNMIIAAGVMLRFGVAAERRSLEDVSRPLSHID